MVRENSRKNIYKWVLMIEAVPMHYMNLVFFKYPFTG